MKRTLSPHGLILFCILFFCSTLIYAQPTNNSCGGAFQLFSGAGCTGGRIGDALRNSGGAATGSGASVLTTTGCTVSATNPVDVWYFYVATSTTPTIQLSNFGPEMNDLPRMQIYNTNTCTAAALNGSQIGCAGGNNVTTLSLTPTIPLTLGNTYLIRVFTDENSLSTTTTSDWSYNICIADAPSNNLCANAISLDPDPFCNNTSGTLTYATYTTIPTLGCGPAAVNDVWYSFVAERTSETITLSSAPANSRVQLFSGGCGALNSIACSSGSSLVASGLTIGQTYHVRVYSTTNATGTFNICITDTPPVNNDCGGTILLTSATTCNTVSGDMFASTASAITVATPNCEPGTVAYDVWYSFVAQTPNPTVTLSNLGSGFVASARMQLLTACSGTATALYCGNTSISAQDLTVGTTYHVRVYAIGTPTTASAANMTFDICVTDPVTPRPFNDTCTNAINLPISAACDNFPGSMAGATPSPVSIGSCTGPVTYDVWFKFTAITTSTEVNLSTGTNNFTNRRFQVLAGSCGSLTNMSPEVCGIAGTASTFNTTVGQTYFIRVYSTTAGFAPNGNAGFNVCVRGVNAPIRFGNSYVNITRKTNGGPVQVGDTLEIRMTINHKSGTIFNARYVDNVPAGTVMLTGTNDSIRIITNEGLTYKKYTLADDLDAAVYRAGPLGTGEHNIRINLGFGGYEPGTPGINTTTSNTSANGRIFDTHNPRGGGGVLFAIAYRVRVTGAVGTTVNLFPGQFLYSLTDGGSDVTLTANPWRILITTPQTLCSNSVGINNAVEDGGTFGNGGTLARQADLSTPIANYSYVPYPSMAVAIGDGRYSVVKNVSPRNSTVRGANQIPACGTVGWTDPANCNNRMYSHWIIDGDHTGTNDAVGNNPPAATTTGGYMLLVNADFVASEAYRQTVNNLCPNTYYEFSAWFRNVCSTCGSDSLARQFTSSADPARHLGVVGVYPNLSFAVDGIDHYSTGEIDFSTGWEKRGFVFQTGPTQTSATFTIRNNSQGGGGNDWAMDDISVSTCLPSMRYSPAHMDSLCMNGTYVVRDTIRSIFNTYTHFKWQRRPSGSSIWTDIPGESGTATPTFAGGQYEYIVNHTIFPSFSTLANNGDTYRVIVSTTNANLSNTNCNYTDGVAEFQLRIMNCNDVLDVNFLSFAGEMASKKANLKWSTSKETTPVRYTVERSHDGVNFQTAGELRGHNDSRRATNGYAFNDTAIIGAKTYYRIGLTNGSGRTKYSKTILLHTAGNEFLISNLLNPFGATLSFDVTTSSGGRVEVFLLDGGGHVVRKQSFSAYKGVNALAVNDVAGLAQGVYILKVEHAGQVLTKKMIKQ